MTPKNILISALFVFAAIKVFTYFKKKQAEIATQSSSTVVAGDEAVPYANAGGCIPKGRCTYFIYRTDANGNIVPIEMKGHYDQNCNCVQKGQTQQRLPMGWLK